MAFSFSLLGLDLTQVEFKFFALQNVTIGTTNLTGSGSDGSCNGQNKRKLAKHDSKHGKNWN